jgi:Xaa-Pro aminopeptidase
VISRIQKLRDRFPALGLDAVLVTHASDMRYLSGFPNPDAWLLVCRKTAYYVTDFRYMAEARKAIKGIRIVQFGDSLFETTMDLARKNRVKVLGVDENSLTLHQFNRIKALAHKGLGIVSSKDVVKVVRAVKEPGELKLMKKALKINLEAYKYIKSYIRPGIREIDLLHKLEEFIRQKNVGFAFDPIIASGPNSSFPHAKVTERKVRRNEPVLIDLGIDVNGYKSDLTRVFFLGRMPRSFERVLSLVRLAQIEAFKVIRPGIEAKKVDFAARGFLDKYGLAERFGHSLGHGVGLDVHELPRISGKSGVTLSEGMVITVEPGVYLKKYGVRLEEMVLVTENGCEVLSVDFNY